MKPDRVILKKVKAYDKGLSILWNNRESYFELWLDRPFWMGGGCKLITPITQSIYNTKKTKTFAPLDDRLLWWVEDADSYKRERNFYKLEDSRWQEMNRLQDQKNRQNHKDRAKDFWTDANSFYVTSNTAYYKKNHKKQESTPWVKPDAQSKASPRIFSRSKGNAKRYDYN